MKTIFSLIIASFLIITWSSCHSGEVALRQGNYDYVIEKNTRLLAYRPKNQDAIKSLEKAWAQVKANEEAVITQLKKGGIPSDRPAIFEKYSLLHSRQEKIRPLLPLYLKKENRQAHFEFSDYSAPLIQAKKDAAEYLYADALRLLNTGSRSDARKAFDQLGYLSEIFPGFRDADHLMARAREEGKNQIFVHIQNKTPYPLPDGMEEELFRLQTTALNEQWANFDLYRRPGIQYDYEVEINLLLFNVSPEQVNERQYRQEKQIPDGWSYVYDKKGHIKVDSTGKAIKIQRFTTIYCDVREVEQKKIAELSTTLKIINLYNGRIEAERPLSAITEFNHRFAQANGNLAALEPRVSALLNAAPQPFPANLEMVASSFETLKPQLLNAISESPLSHL